MKLLYRGAIGTGSGTLAYTVPTTYKTTLEAVTIANTSSSAITCTAHLVTSGGSPSSSNQFLPAVSIPANTSLDWSGRQVLNPGDFVQLIGSASGLSANLSGTEERVVK